MRFKKGDIVKVDWDSVIDAFDNYIKREEKMLGRSHPATKDLIKRRNDVASHKDMTAKVTGSHDYGSYIHLVFDDGFEMGVERSRLEKI